MSVSDAAFDVRDEGGAKVLAFRGRLDVDSAGPIWARAVGAAQGVRVVDAAGIEYCDGAGIGLLIELRRRAGVEIRGLAPDFQALLDLVPAEKAPPLQAPPRRFSLPVEMGRATAAVLHDMRVQVAFIGEVLLTAASAIGRRRQFRWGDALLVAEAAGVQALPIISLIGLLIGLILAFQSATPLQQFGAEIYAADLVAVAVVRELGPLMTSIVVAGRTGSAFAAELGTMKVNEEIDALTTMGLAPVRFLVLPRVAAGIVVMPLLTIYFNVLALVGGGFVILSMGYTLRTYVTHVLSALTVGSLMNGLLKAIAFGVIVAGIGCQRGLSTGTGAVSVGLSTTRSVVAGILLTILVDGAFAVFFYALGI